MVTGQILVERQYSVVFCVLMHLARQQVQLLLRAESGFVRRL